MTTKVKNREFEVAGDLIIDATELTDTMPGSIVEVHTHTPDDPTIQQWMRLSETAPGMSFWNDAEEDIYTEEDGNPI